MNMQGKSKLTRREILKLLGITAGGAVLSSCGPAPTPTEKSVEPTAMPPTEAPASTEAPAPTDAPSAEMVTLSLWFGEYGDDIMQEAFDAYEDQFGVHIDWLNVPEFWVKIPAAAAAGELPDVIIMGDTDIPTFAVKNVLLPLNEYADSVDLSDFVQSAIAHSSWAGELYGMPFECGPSMWVYNKGLVDEAGLEDPWELAKKGEWTQAVFDETIKVLSKGEGDDAQWGTFEPAKSIDIQAPFLKGFGGDRFNEDFTECTLNSEGCVAGYTYILQQKWDGYAADPSDAVAGHTGILPLFNAGKVGFVYFPRGLWPALNHDLDLGLAPPYVFTVAGEAYTRHGVNIFSVNQETEYPQEGWDFLYFFATEGNDILVKNQSGTPNRYAALDSPLWLDSLKVEGWEDPEAWKMGFNATLPTIAPPGQPEINDLAQAAYDSAYLKEQTVQEAFDEVVEQANQILAEQIG